MDLFTFSVILAFFVFDCCCHQIGATSHSHLAWPFDVKATTLIYATYYFLNRA